MENETVVEFDNGKKYMIVSTYNYNNNNYSMFINVDNDDDIMFGVVDNGVVTCVDSSLLDSNILEGLHNNIN